MQYAVEEIRRKGKELGYSYVQALSLYLFEKILVWVSNSSFQQLLWLKPEETLGARKRKTNLSNEMIFYMPNPSYITALNMMEALCKDKAVLGDAMEWSLLFYDQQLEIPLKVQLEQVDVAFRIVIRPVWQEDCYPEADTWELLLDKGEKLAYQRYPMELNLAECFYEILDHLELIGSMESYVTAYRILTNQTVDGRRIYLDIQELLKRRSLPSWQERWDTIAGYAEYGYMKRRWKRHYKGVPSGEIPEWEQVIDRLDTFWRPLWDAICQDQIFCGDWMPSLGRYLD